MSELPPGPWEAAYDPDIEWHIDMAPDDGSGPFVILDFDFVPNPDAHGDIARLWAAAPDLLAALTEALPYLMDHLDADDAGEWRVVEAAVRAVSRAAGQEVRR